MVVTENVERLVDTGPLDLDAIELGTVRPEVKLGGSIYRLATDDDLGLDSREDLRRALVRLRELEQAPDSETSELLNDVELTVYRHITRRICRIALVDAAETDIDGLTALQQNRLVSHFLGSGIDLRRYTDRLLRKVTEETVSRLRAMQTASENATTAPDGSSENAARASSEPIPSPESEDLTSSASTSPSPKRRTRKSSRGSATATAAV